MPEPLAPLVGRVAERQILHGVLAEAVAGQGAMILIEGEAGIGKSRLATAILDEGRALAMQCFGAASSELDRHRPFGPVADALILGRGFATPSGSAVDPPAEVVIDRPAGGSADPLVGSAGDRPNTHEIVSLTRQLAQLVSGEIDGAGTFLLSGGAEAEFRIIDELIELVELRCQERPMLLVLEDLHWADPSTLLALNRLLREVSGLPCAIVATMQPLALGSERRALREQLVARGARHLPLRRLTEEEIAALAGHLLGAPPGPLLAVQLRRAGGNPFFATELVDALERGGAILHSGGVAEVTGDEFPLPESVGNAIVHRVSFISEEILETLQVASILGSAFSVSDLASSTGNKPAALGPQLATAVRAGILGEDGTRLAFRHDLIREVLYQRMDAPLRSWLHLAIAHVLGESGHPREEVAGHVARGARPGDQHASELLRTAARDVASRSPAVAAELLDRAIEVAPADSLHRVAALADLASYRLQGGRLADAESICRELLGSGVDASLEGQVRVCLVEAIIGRGRLAEGLAEIEVAIATPGLTDSHRARLLSLASTCQAASWDPDGALSSAARALSTAERAGDEIACGMALCNLSVANTLKGNFPEAVGLAEAGLARAAIGVGRRTQPFLPVLTLASALVDADRPAESRQLLERWRHRRLRGGAG
ncbi:MAG: ATP-binding protein, partial [Actinomycetota bacterium]